MTCCGDKTLEKYSIDPQAIISPHRILFLNKMEKKDALIALAEKLADAPQIKNREELIGGILSREESISTAIGNGIAIPHIRLSSITDLVAAVGISKTDIQGFQPPDKEPVRLIFMIAAAYSQYAYYLQALSWFGTCFKKKELRSSLLGAKTPQEVYRLVTSGLK